MRTLLPYSLEDQLLYDLDQLHFAIGHSNNQQWPAISVTHQQMQAWLTPWNEKNIVVQAAYTDINLLPQQSDSWSIYKTDEICLIRTTEGLGYAIDIDSVEDYLKDQSCIDYEQQSLLELFSETNSNLNNAINLLQAEYQVKQKKSPSKRYRYLSIALAIIVVLLFASTITIKKYRLNAAEETLQQAVWKEYSAIFPQASNLVAPKQRTKQLLENLQQQRKSQTFLTLLTTVGKVFKDTPSVRISQLKYSDKTLLITANSPNFETLNQLNSALKKLPLKIEQTNAQQKQEYVTATFSVKQ